MHLSGRATAGIEKPRDAFSWSRATRTEPRSSRIPNGSARWWTFAGTAANAELARVVGTPAAAASGLGIRVPDRMTFTDVAERLRIADAPEPETAAEFADAYKFGDTLPADAAAAMLAARERDPAAVAAVKNRSPERCVAGLQLTRASRCDVSTIA